MELLWFPFAMGALVFYGLGQVFAKETRADIRAGNIMLLLSGIQLAVFGAYFLAFREEGAHPLNAWLIAVASAALSAAAYIVYYEALKHGKVSIIGTVSGAYAPWTVILALVFLGETMSYGEAAGVALVVAGMLIFTYSPNGGNGRKTELLGIGLAILSLFLWGTSAAVAKEAIGEVGTANFMGVFGAVCAIVWTSYWLASTKGTYSMPSNNKRLLLTSLVFLSIGGASLYVAIDNGPVSIVSPVVNLYPVLTISVAKMRLKEKLDTKQYLALAMLLGAIPLFSL